MASSALKSPYLILYNGTFAALWLTLLIRIGALGPLSSYGQTYAVVGDFAKWIQTAALLEVVHAAIGQLIPAPVFPPPNSASMNDHERG
jgi:very-long-chain (3R)-3-hydroxyacyl-CoA dehydratase